MLRFEDTGTGIATIVPGEIPAEADRAEVRVRRDAGRLPRGFGMGAGAVRLEAVITMLFLAALFGIGRGNWRTLVDQEGPGQEVPAVALGFLRPWG